MRTSPTVRASRKATDSPSPMVGSLHPAASPTSTAPSTAGWSVHESNIGYAAHGPAIRPLVMRDASGMAATVAHERLAPVGADDESGTGRALAAVDRPRDRRLGTGGHAGDVDAAHDAGPSGLGRPLQCVARHRVADAVGTSDVGEHHRQR